MTRATQTDDVAHPLSTYRISLLIRPMAAVLVEFNRSFNQGLMRI
jgi:hypothetical protein